MLDRYLAAAARSSTATPSWPTTRALAALNVARILGIFARLIARDGKPRYRAFMPRMWRYLDAQPGRRRRWPA